MPAPTRRVVLLGASNLTRSFATVVETIRQTWREPVEIMAAMGHGRSYGQETTVLGRKISGIFPCALWHDLARRPALPTSALLTDIGNDLLYEVPVEQLLHWVESCLERLNENGATTLITELPLANLTRLGEARFRFFRRLLFPRCRLTLPAALAMAHATNQGLVAMAERKKIPVIPAKSAWYGLDPIHLKRGAWPEAWPALLSSWREATAPPIVPRVNWWTRAYLFRLAPWEQSVFGIERRCEQPCGLLNDGTTISLY